LRQYVGDQLSAEFGSASQILCGGVRPTSRCIAIEIACLQLKLFGKRQQPICWLENLLVAAN